MDEKGSDTDIPSGIKTRVLAEKATKEDFPQGCQFSPDGLCVLTSQCNRLELYNTQSTGSKGIWKPALTCKGGDTVRSYTWYPHMNSADPATCCFAGVSRDQPAHLYDAYTGGIRATYRPYNGLDEMESPTVVRFVENGSRLATGGFRTDRMIHLFDLNRPGRDSASILKLGKTRRSKDGQKGLVSALAPSLTNVLAVGTYSPGSIYLYDLRAQSTQVAEIIVTGTCVVGHGKAHSRKRKHFVTDDGESDPLDFSAAKIKWFQGRARGGVTQVEFSGDGISLYSLSRRANAVLQWDLRRLSSSSFCPGIASYDIQNDTNQRIEFSLHDDSQIWVGGQDKCIRVYDTNKPNNPMALVDKFPGVVNGVSVTKLGQQVLVSASSGSRLFPSDDDWDEDDPHLRGSQKDLGMLQLLDVTFRPSEDVL